MTPQRIQRKRARGWRLPPGAVCVTRPGRWGNPWREGSTAWTIGPGGVRDKSGKVLTRKDAVDSFRFSIICHPELVDEVVRELRGRDLACWCKPGDLCHGDVLLEIANSPVWAAPAVTGETQ